MKKQVFKIVLGLIVAGLSAVLSRLLDMAINTAYNESIGERLTATGPVNQWYRLAEACGDVAVFLVFFAGLGLILWGADGIVRANIEKKI